MSNGVKETVNSLNDTDFYRLCRKISATSVFLSYDGKRVLVARLVADGHITAEIEKLTGISRSQIKRIRRELDIAAPPHVHSRI